MIQPSPTGQPHGPTLYLARHGATAWSETGQHTGRTDLPLLPKGEAQAAWLRARLAAVPFACVLSSPLQRAHRTAELAGFGDRVQVDPSLLEMNYGDDEGRTTADLAAEVPGWDVFTTGPRNGETVAEVAQRAAQVLAKVSACPGDVLLFSHGHFLRILAAVYLGVPPTFARHLELGAGSLSVLAHLHDQPSLRHWNLLPDPAVAAAPPVTGAR